jgi:opacity protein-like surface antigen
MLKPILKSLFLSMLFISSAFADDTLSSFNQQEDINYPSPDSEDSYFATRAPMESGSRHYLGFNIGTSYSSLKPKITRSSSEEKLSKKAIAYAAGAYGGWGMNFDHFYIGAELSGGYDTLDRKLFTTALSDTTLSVKRSFGVGLDLMPGYITMQKDFLFYGRLGMGAGLFQFKINDDSNSSSREIAFGLRAGLGMEYFMNDNLSLRFEYLLNSYGDIEKNYTIGATRYIYKFSSPTTQQVNLGLTINF